MPLPTFRRFAGVAAIAAAFLAPADLLAQQELQYSIAGRLFNKPALAQAVLTKVPEGLRIQAVDRSELAVVAPLAAAQLGGRSMPPRQEFELTRVVVRFNTAKTAGASLGSIRLTGEYGGTILDVMTKTQGGRSPFEATPPHRVPAMTVNTHTLVRLVIDSPLPLDAPGPDAPPKDFPYRGEPFVLVSVDVYVKARAK